ncbi:MAG: hypothetical protein JJU21_16365 [Salinarimonas sp.]|nr:hypothetical protein [Salinarimonas sp.]
MSKLIEQVFDYAISSAPSDDERARLVETKRVCEIVRAIESAADRKAIIAVLEEHPLLSDLADEFVDCRLISFPIKGATKH